MGGDVDDLGDLGVVHRRRRGGRGDVDEVVVVLRWGGGVDGCGDWGGVDGAVVDWRGAVDWLGVRVVVRGGGWRGGRGGGVDCFGVGFFDDFVVVVGFCEGGVC